MNTFFCSMLAFLSLASCTFINNAAGNEYQLVNPKTPLNITLGFNKNGSFYGGALNRYFGAYKTAGNTITFTNVASTKMAGSPEDMKAENEYFKAINGTLEFKIEEDGLTLKNTAGEELTYKKLPKKTK